MQNESADTVLMQTDVAFFEYLILLRNIKTLITLPPGKGVMQRLILPLKGARTRRTRTL
ncbi:Hypothetical protein MPUT9231_3760 [Mycoplasma putrefaciens Mput9231]|uniref:Uncharacterized protein n=1 Tax=Mycoplasma putrefaciens Mput9231 TaxID=1292033 RepID=M9WH58_9MOLU|nr:Hypothetical protein MPUT9231_3760 [Mycoplasma putrefaciens Mput9231]